MSPKARFICFSSSGIACYQPCFPWKCLSFCLNERYTSSEWAWLLMSFIWGGLFIVLKENSHFGIYVWKLVVAFFSLFGSKPTLNVSPGLLIFQVIYLRGMFYSRIWSPFKKENQLRPMTECLGPIYGWAYPINLLVGNVFGVHNL